MPCPTCPAARIILYLARHALNAATEERDRMGHKTAPGTLLDLLESGAPSHPAIVAPGGPVVTYDSLRRQVRTLVGQLRAMGIDRGDRVAIVLPNSIETIVTFLAVAAAGTAAPLNPAYKAAEFEFYMDDTKAKALITQDDGGEEARSAADASVMDIRAETDEEGRVSLSGPGGATLAAGLETAPPEPDDVALVLHTSGTTSRPKRVPLAHRNLTASVENIVETYNLSDSRRVALRHAAVPHTRAGGIDSLGSPFGRDRGRAGPLQSAGLLADRRRARGPRGSRRCRRCSRRCYPGPGARARPRTRAGCASSARAARPSPRPRWSRWSRPSGCRLWRPTA